MKKYLILLISLFFLVMPDNVTANESLGTCTYNLDNNVFGLGMFQSISLKVTVYDDGSTGDRKISTVSYDGKEWSETPRSGLMLDNSGIFLQYSKMFNKNGKFYKAYVERGNCPTMQFIYYNNTYQLHFNLGSQANPDNFPSQSITPESTGGSSSTPPSQPVTYCNERLMPVRNSSLELKFTTIETNGVREFEVQLGPDSSRVMYNQTAAVGGFYFSINPDDYNSFFSTQCQDMQIFMRAPSTENIRIFQTTRPSDEENGSFSIGDASTDDGYGHSTGDWQFLGDDPEFGSTEIGCDSLFDTTTPGAFGWVLKTILNYVKVIGPILVVLLSAIDFIKAVIGTDEKAMKEAQNKLIIRLVAAVALFLVPTLVQLLLSFINQTYCAI